MAGIYLILRPVQAWYFWLVLPKVLSRWVLVRTGITSHPYQLGTYCLLSYHSSQFFNTKTSTSQYTRTAYQSGIYCLMSYHSSLFFDTKTSTSQYTRVAAWHPPNTGIYNQKMFPDYTPSILHGALHSGPHNLAAKLEILRLRSQAPTLPIAERKPQTHMEKSLDWVVTWLWTPGTLTIQILWEICRVPIKKGVILSQWYHLLLRLIRVRVHLNALARRIWHKMIKRPYQSYGLRIL